MANGVNRTFNSQYDSASNRTVLSSPSDYYAAFTYDALGRMSAYKEGATTVVGFDYDNAGRRSALRFGAGATSSVNYGYDDVGRLDRLGRELSGTGADQVLDFTHNPASQIATRSSTNDAYASNTAYNVSRPYQVNGLNQYQSAGPANFTYDANGNLTSDGSTGFVYDAENRLVSATGAWNATLAYDPLGRLWQIGSAAGTKRFVYDGDRLVEEYDGAGNRPRVYVHGPGADEPLVWYEFTGGPIHHFYHADHQGSIVALADDYGNALAINAYDPWGIPNAGTVPNKGRFQYTGQAWIAELGLYYYKARLYSPTLGRFLQTDPIGYDDQINLYAYVANDPVNKTDPTGLADLNLVRPSDRAYDEGENADFRGAFTIFAHSNTTPDERFGVVDQRGSGHARLLNPRALLAAAQAEGYRRGGLTLLISCTTGVGRNSYAQQYANLSGGRTVASPGVIAVRNLSDTTVRMRAHRGLFAYDPGRQQATYLGNRIVYNSRTGYGTIATERPGSRLPEQKRVCLRDRCED